MDVRFPQLRKLLLFSHDCRHREEAVKSQKELSFGRINCYVFGIVGKLFQNAREWSIIHVNQKTKQVCEGPMMGGSGSSPPDTHRVMVISPRSKDAEAKCPCAPIPHR